MSGAKLKRRLFAFCVLQFAVALSCASPEERASHSLAATQAFNQGVKAFNAQQFADAIPFFDKAIEHDDQFADAFYARAACKHYLKDSQAALSDLNEALRVRPDYLDAYALRGVVYYETEQWDPAYEDFNYVLQKKPKDTQSLLGRGAIALKKNQLATAQHDLGLFLKLRPEDPLAPRLRKLLSSLSADSNGVASSSEDEEEPEGQTPRPKGVTQRKNVSATSQRLGEDLFTNSHQLSDTFTRKVIRGERAEAVGDINAVRQAPPTTDSSDSGVQIVEPK